MRRKEVIQTGDLYQATAGRASGDLPWRFFLRFQRTQGLSAVTDRETHAVLTGEELARIIGSIPMSSVTSDEDAAAISRVGRLLRSSAYNTTEK